MRHWLSLSMLLALLAQPSGAEASPCQPLSRRLSADQRARLASALAARLEVPKIEVLRAFQSGSWSLVEVDTPRSDAQLLFLARDPGAAPPVARWGGVARGHEEAQIRRWAVENAPGIPPPLARCFAWYVTHGRR